MGTRAIGNPAMELAARRRATALAPARIDALCLAAIVVLGSLPWLAYVGFYTDDWQFLELFHRALGSAPLDFLRFAALDPFVPRPGHGAYAALLYAWFGLDPLGYHIVNLAVLAGAVLLLRTLLAELGLDRRTAFAIAATFALLPQLSTIKLWFAAFQITLALFFFLLSCLAELRWARGRGAGWKLLSLAALVASLSLYEIFAPLFVAVAAAAGMLRWYRARPVGLAARALCLAPALPNMVFVAAGLLLKAHASARADPLTLSSLLRTAKTLLRPDYDWRIDNGLNVVAAPLINFGDAALRPLAAPFHALGSNDGAAPLLAALAIAAIVAWRMRGAELLSRSRARLLVGIGLVVFALGFALFVTSRAVVFSPAGLANRTAVAAALGVAAVFVGLAHLAARIVPARYASVALVAGMAIMAGGAGLRGSEVDRHWAGAAAKQRAVLRHARSALARLPAGSTVMLDGVCPYDGPGVVFETNWDTGGALSLALGRTIRADAISARTAVRADGIATTIYGVETLYPYGPLLFAWNPARGWLASLKDMAAARRYFARPGRYAAACPRGYVGHGVPI
jgi:hypothetical protein